MTRVSIIIPVHNVEEYIAECLESVIAQTYDHGMIECILVDDCTPDHSMDVARHVFEGYHGAMTIKMLKHETNSGLSASRNTGIEAASGDFLFFVDSDDRLYPETLQVLTEQLKVHPDADLIVGNWYDETRACNNYCHTQPFCSNNANYLFLGNTKKITAWNSLIRRSIITHHNLRFVVGMYFEDVPFNYQLYSRIGKYIIIPNTTYFYRKNISGIMSSGRSSKCNKTIHDYCLMLHIMVKNLDHKLYVGKSNIIFFYLLIAEDFINTHYKDIKDISHVRRYLRHIINIMMKRHLKNMRIFMASELSLCYYLKVLKWGVVRRNINKFTRICYLPAMALNGLHKQ